MSKVQTFHRCTNGVRLYRDVHALNAVQQSPAGTTIVTIPLADLIAILGPQSWWSRFVRRHIVDDDPDPIPNHPMPQFKGEL